jgi:glycerol kinase
MANFILAVDQSTTTTKAVIFDKKAKVVGRYDIDHKQIYPQKGWVEHDPVEIYQNLVEAVRCVLETTGVSTNDIAALAVTNQRETTVMWTPDGKPVHNAIVWQCTRAEFITRRPEIDAERAYITQATGLQLSPYFSAAKAAWIKETCGVNEKLMFGTIDSWVIWNLTGRHVTDYSNASRTQLFNIHQLSWDKKILKLFGLENVKMPEVHFSDEIFGMTTVEGIFETPIPVAGDLGDSHGSLFAQKCWKIGTGKCTYGTGGSIMMNIGTVPMLSSNKIATSIAWGLAGTIEYVFEGHIICMGDTIKWLINELGLIQNSAESQVFAEKVDSSNGVYLVPAFDGLGAPYWKSEVSALICGLSRSANKYHIVRAGVESIAYQIRDIIEPMLKDARIELKELRVDGGPTKNTFLMQFTADILNTLLVCSSVEELSALGAAFAGGIAVGFWKNREEISLLTSTCETFERTMPKETAESLYEGWQNAINMLILGSERVEGKSV